jgi:hypothetical protein
MKYRDLNITKKFLDENPNAIFVFGDNDHRTGYGGAAILRDHPQTYGFITKRAPDNMDLSFYRPDDFKFKFLSQAIELQIYIGKNKDKIFYISKLGAGLANRYQIWEKVIKEGLIKYFSQYPNVVFLWKENG